MAQSRTVRIWQRKQIRLDRLTFTERMMFTLGNVGVASVKNRVSAAQGPTDGPAKPLTKNYAIRKTKRGKGNRRNLTVTGDMLRNIQVRTVRENRAKAAVTSRKERIKAWANEQRERWLVFSPRNLAAVLEAARRVFAEMAPRLALERFLGGKQR